MINMIGNCSFKTECKSETKLFGGGGGEEENSIEVGWEQKCKQRKVIESRSNNDALWVVSVVVPIVTEQTFNN
jgi:hypothetical protein